MAREDAVVAQWFDVLGLQQDCARDVNHDTADELRAFYSQKHATVLFNDDLRHTFASCFFNKTAGVSGVGIGITDDDFAHTSTFHELLDAAFRPLRNSVRALFRRVAIELGRVPDTTDPADFETLKAVSVYTNEGDRTEMTARLRAVMPTFSGAAEAALRKQLQDAAARVTAAIDAVL